MYRFEIYFIDGKVNTFSPSEYIHEKDKIIFVENDIKFILPFSNVKYIKIINME